LIIEPFRMVSDGTSFMVTKKLYPLGFYFQLHSTILPAIVYRIL
jgi:hypothetical protein